MRGGAAGRSAAGVLAMLGLLGCTRSPPASQGRKERVGPFGNGIAVANPGVAEPSGIAFHPRLGHLFTVGDEGTLAELDGQGGFVRSASLGANLEDVAVHGPSGDLVLLDEVKAALIVYDPVARAVKARWRLDADEVLGRSTKGRDGFEGIAFRPEAGRAGGGVFYLTHQRGPAMLVAIAFDPAAAPQKIGASAVVGRWTLEGQADLTAVSWSEELQRLLVLADSEDELLVVKTDGQVQARLKMPGVNQEGVCLDAAGDLWIADDRGGSVVRYAGARQALEGPLYSMLVK